MFKNISFPDVCFFGCKGCGLPPSQCTCGLSYLLNKTYFSNQASLFILNMLDSISAIFLFFARLNFYFLVIAMLFYLFHDLHINSFDLFVDFWIKYQFIYVNNFSSDLIIYLACFICNNVILNLSEKYEDIIYNSDFFGK